jgi:4-hydroxy-2-oxoheptanedioate aldolase
VSTAFADRLRDGRPLVGTVLSLPGVALAELAAAPFDLVWIDLEHGALSLGEAQELAVAVQASGCAAAVRVSRWDAELLPAVLDAGVDAIVAPGVETAAQAGELAARLHYPPDGRRGYGPRRAGGYGRTPRFWTAPNARPALLVQVETRAAVEAAAAIAAVPGVDALVVGVADLSFDLGAPLAPASPSLTTAVAAVRDAAAAAGIAFGAAGPGEPATLAALAGPAASLLLCSVDVRIYSRAVDDVAAALRAALSINDQEDRGVRV